MLESFREKYRQIRKRVYQDATFPKNGDSAQHERNRACFKAQVVSLCDAASLDRYRADSAEARRSLWHLLWSRIRYAGFSSQAATNEIRDLSPCFDDYEWFVEPEWDIQAKGHEPDWSATGPTAADFLNHRGRFAGCRVVGNVAKLKKHVAIARVYSEHFRLSPHSSALQFVVGPHDESAVWEIHRRLLNTGYKADLTALHFMMDAGFPVIKPDVVVSRLFLEWGWLRHVAPHLPSDLTRKDLVGKGVFGNKFNYQKPAIYKPIIDLAREIVGGIDRAQCEADIGWATSNALREFDIFIAKAGQRPECCYGIERQLFL